MLSNYILQLSDYETNKPLDFNQITFEKARAGVHITKKIRITNAHIYTIELTTPRTSDSRISIISYPDELRPNQSGIIEFQYAPYISDTVPIEATWGFDIDVVREAVEVVNRGR